MQALLDLLYPVLLGAIWLVNLLTAPLLKVLIPIRSIVTKELSQLGIRINPKKGTASPGDVQIHNDKFYERLALERTLGLGEMYMEGWWDCERLDVLIAKLVAGGMYEKTNFPWHRFLDWLRFRVFNLQTAARSWEVAEKHFDLGNELYSSFMDSRMMYTCGYWKNAKDLEEAQERKLDLIAQKLYLKPGMRVLDVGCGWGGLSKFLAERYKVSVVAVTVSKEGAKRVAEVCKGLPVEVRVQDYRDIVGEKFDRVAAIGLMEHVGRKNHRTLLELAHRCLPPHGLMMLHTIAIDSDYLPATEAWLNKYIFPNGELPHHRDISQAVNNLFTIEDWHNFGADYDKTLMAWNENFVKNWPTIQHLFPEPTRFFRMWQYYLLTCAGSFRARKLQLWQIVLSKDGVPGGYVSIR